jgi:predicted transcriptional regulator
MTLTITLPPEAEQQLRERAAREGQDAETVAAAVLVEALAWEARDSAEAIRGIQRGLDDFAAGRFRPFQEFAEEQRRKYDLPKEG